ncbi:MAG: MFS transporter [Dehalococcoidia bacterium]
MLKVLVGSHAVAPLRYRDFRVLIAVSTLNMVAMMGSQVAIGWFVLELTDSPFMVAVASALRMLPNFILGMPAGAIADIVDRRRLIQTANLLVAMPMIAVGLLVAGNNAELWMVIAITTLGGIFQVFNMTARSSLAFDITGSSGALQGLTLMRLTGGIGGLVGSVVIGFVTARIGIDAAFFSLGGIYALSAVVSLFIKGRGQAAPTTRSSPWDSLKGLGTQMRSNRSLALLTLSTGLAEMLGFSHMVLLPSIARDVLGFDAAGLGLLSGFRNLGGVVGSIFLATVGDRPIKGLLYQASLLVFGGLMLLLSFSSQFSVVVVLLVSISAMMAVTSILSQSLMQLVVPNELRGRAMGVWQLAIGTSPAGSVQIGAMASLAGLTVALSLNGFGLVLVALSLLLFAPSMRKL